jgi:hypothetical protein
MAPTRAPRQEGVRVGAGFDEGLAGYYFEECPGPPRGALKRP